MSFIVLDTETTGLPKFFNRTWKKTIYAPYFLLSHYKYSRIVQFSWISYNDKNKFEWINDHIVKPTYDFEISQKVVNIHGISTEKAKKEGIDINIVLDMFYTSLKRVDIIVAHNIKFDLQIILSECFRIKRTDIIKEIYKKKWICTVQFAMKILNYGRRIRLGTLHKKLFKNDFKNAHNSLADTIACANCYIKLKSMNLISTGF